LDTDVCVDLLREPQALISRLRPLEERGPLLTTAITVQELYEGAHRAHNADRERRRVEHLLRSLDVLSYGESAATAAGGLAGALLDDGAPIGDLDTAIAAITLEHDATLVTRNVDHFSKVPDLAIHAL